VLNSLLLLLKSNPLVAGGAGMAVVGWVLMQARALPLQAWRTVKAQFSTSMTIYSEDSLFRMVDLWLARHPSAKYARRFAVAEWHDSQDKDEYALTPGAGLHLLREGMRFFLVSRHVESEKSTSNDFSRQRKQTIEITTFGRSKRPLNELLDRIKTIQEDHNTIPIYLWTSYEYSLIDRRLKRPMDTVYARETIKKALVDDLMRFLGEREWYAERAVPYRRGYLLEGPPGTGKTTLIQAIASLLERPIYVINPSAIENDNQLQKALNSAGSNIVVIEDIDSVKATEERDQPVRKRTPRGQPPGPIGEASKSGITLSGLLNAIDGIGARDGRILFITSNHPDTLDPALIRPGRIDMRLHLAHSEIEEASAMFSRFYPKGDLQAFQTEIAAALPLPAAELQNRLLSRKRD